ncbi:protein ddi1 2 [Echinococcus multilocularis]|uniref:Protein ddi1 2 n=1 Tax=Echinococcus multilocularis TaxID=6211 RepID=A0A068Y9Y4_ECHMU|nr:protein ddi1 2 [Echinococcus multilocularis]
MRLSFVLPDGRLVSFDTPSETLMSSLRLMVSIEAGVPESKIVLLKNDQRLAIESSNTVNDCNLRDNDLLSVQFGESVSSVNNPLPGSAVAFPGSSTSPNPLASVSAVETVRQSFLRLPDQQLARICEQDPRFYEALQDSDTFWRYSQTIRPPGTDFDLTAADPLDPEVQRQIERLIRQQNIDREMESAMEHYPETFGAVTMLYVACEVNGFPMKAFVDSGAQTTLMSLSCARSCNLEHLIDKRFQGMAYGVGTQKIIGRIHQAQLKLGGTAVPTSFIVLEEQQMDIMIGLDMLKRHRCCINLAENVLTVGDHTNVPFLPESELPAFAKPSSFGLVSQVTSSSDEAFTEEQLSKVRLLTSQNVPRERAIALLQATNWDPDMALVQYMSSLP